MIETILIIIAILLASLTHVLSAIKSGCFYWAMRQRGSTNPVEPELLKKYINNLHYVQTPFWYSLFGCVTVLFFLLFYKEESLGPDTWEVFLNITFYKIILKSFMLSMGASAIVSPIYQGFVNVGNGLPFVDPNENKSMELADPISGKKRWFKRFWHGRGRIVAAVLGLISICIALLLL